MVLQFLQGKMRASILRGGWKNGRLSAIKIEAFVLVGPAAVNC